MIIALCLFRVLPASVYFLFEWLFLLNANYGTIMLFNAGQQVFLGYDMTISHLNLLIIIFWLDSHMNYDRFYIFVRIPAMNDTGRQGCGSGMIFSKSCRALPTGIRPWIPDSRIRFQHDPDSRIRLKCNPDSRARIFETFKEPKNRIQGANSARLCSLAGRYDSPIPTRFLAPIDCLKIQHRIRVQKDPDFGIGYAFSQTLIPGSAFSVTLCWNF